MAIKTIEIAASLLIKITIIRIADINKQHLLITLVSVSKTQYAITIKGSGNHNILFNSHWQNSIATVVDMFTYLSAQFMPC